MTIGLVGQNQITTFTSPVNGTSPIDANVVRGNDNTSKTAFNVHDSDATVHLQSSLASARPPAGVPGRKWLDSDTYRLYYDDGAVWHELAYIGGGGPATINGKLTVNGDVQAERNLIAQGPDNLATGVILANKVGTSTRWYLSTDGTPEGASDAGENLVLGAYSNAGTLIDQPIGIERKAGGTILVKRPVNLLGTLNVAGSVVFNPNLTVGLTEAVSHYIFLNSTNTAGVVFQHDATNKWVMGRAVAVAGDDFHLYNSALGTLAMAVSSANNTVTFAGPVVIGTDPGGARLLRVGGGALFTQRVTVQGTIATDTAADFQNSSSTGYGVYVLGGNTTNYAFEVRDYTNALLFTVNGTRVSSPLDISALTYSISGQPFARADPTYTILRAPDGNSCFLIGGPGDPTNYYYNTSHSFRNRASTVTYAILSQGSLNIYNTSPTQLQLNAQNSGGSAQLLFASGASNTQRWLVGINASIGSDNFEIMDAVSGVAMIRGVPGSRQCNLSSNAPGGYAWSWSNTGASQPYGLNMIFPNAAPNNATQDFLHFNDSVGNRGQWYSNGGIANYQANNVNFSDATLKAVGAVLDPRVWWDRLAAIEIRAFKYLDQTHDDDNIGLIAQQVQAVAPELVDEAIPATETSPALLGVYTADLFHAHIAVTQELQRRVLALEAKLLQ